MTDELDILRAAKVVIDQYGEDAVVHAAVKADQFLERGDVVAASMWKLIIKAIEDLEQMGPEGETVH